MTEAFDAVDVIAAKRDRNQLTDAQIDWVIDAYTHGRVADEQMAALAMAILLNGMSRREVARWTGRTSISGVYLDRVGHYLCEAAFMVGLGLRAGGLDDWAADNLLA